MRQAVAPTIVMVLFGASLLLAAPAVAQDSSSSYLMGVFAEQPTVAFLQPSLAIDDPAGKKASMCDAAAACKGPLTAPLAFVEAVNPLGAEFKIATPVIGTMWVSADHPILVNAMRMELVINNVATVIGHNPQATGNPLGYVFTEGDGTPTQLTATPTKFTFAAAPPTNTIKADHKIGLRVYMSAIGLGRPDQAVPAGTSPINIYVHFGTLQYPTGVVFGTSISPGSQAYGCAVNLSLTETGLAFGAPTGEASAARVVDFSGPTPPPIHSAVAATEFEWGAVPSDRPYTFVSDAALALTLRLPAAATGAAPVFGVTANLYVGTLKLNASTNTYEPRVYNNAHAAVGPNAPVKLLLALPTGGHSVDAGTSVRLTLQIYQLTGAVNDLEVLYGSTTDPSGILMAAEAADCGAAPAPPVAAPPEQPPPEPLDDGNADADEESLEEEEPETIVDEEGAGTAQEVEFKDASIPANVPGPAALVVLLAVVAIAVVLRRRP